MVDTFGIFLQARYFDTDPRRPEDSDLWSEIRQQLLSRPKHEVVAISTTKVPIHVFSRRLASELSPLEYWHDRGDRSAKQALKTSNVYAMLETRLRLARERDMYLSGAVEKMYRKREREGGCEGVTVWM